MYVWRRLGSVLAGLLLCAACVVLAVFLHHEGIVLAGAWAGVIGLFGIPIGALGVWLAWPRSRQAKELSEQESQTSVQHNEASHHGTTFAVQDGSQIIYYKQPGDIPNTTRQQHSGKRSEQ